MFAQVSSNVLRFTKHDPVHVCCTVLSLSASLGLMYPCVPHFFCRRHREISLIHSRYRMVYMYHTACIRIAGGMTRQVQQASGNFRVTSVRLFIHHPIHLAFNPPHPLPLACFGSCSRLGLVLDSHSWANCVHVYLTWCCWVFLFLEFPQGSSRNSQRRQLGL